MSSAAAKPPIRDPNRIPTVEDIDRQLGPFSRYARTVRGAARVAGLSARLTWTPSGWVEHLRWDESLIGIIHLNKSPPTAEIGVSRALEEAAVPRISNELLKKAISKADGTNIKWVEMELIGPEPAEAMATLVSLKSELLVTAVVPLSPAERAKPIVRPMQPHDAAQIVLAAANRAPSRRGKPVRSKARPKPKKAAARSAKRSQPRPAKKAKVAKARPKPKAAKRRR